MTLKFEPDEKTRRNEKIFRHGWEMVAFFGGLALCLAVVLVGHHLWV